MERWSTEKADAWLARTGWICGFNFLPSTAVNFLEMWHRDTFDRATISRELGWASELGFNALRVNLHYLIWKYDRDGLTRRLDWLMTTANSEVTTQSEPQLTVRCVVKSVIGDTIIILLMLATLIL